VQSIRRCLEIGRLDDRSTQPGTRAVLKGVSEVNERGMRAGPGKDVKGETG
jgi:hypothetical protein